MVGYVKKTITEAIGETSVTTAVEFETYEDFMAYEKSLSASQVAFATDQSLEIAVNEPDEDGWIWHDGESLPKILSGKVDITKMVL